MHTVKEISNLIICSVKIEVFETFLLSAPESIFFFLQTQVDASMQEASGYWWELVLKCLSTQRLASAYSPLTENVAPPESLIVSAALTADAGAAGSLLKCSSRHSCHLQTQFRLQFGGKNSRLFVSFLLWMWISAPSQSLGLEKWSQWCARSHSRQTWKKL